MYKIKKAFLLFLFVISASSFGQDNPFNVVQELFSAMSAVNHTKMKSTVTDDFELLEHGEYWDIDVLIKVVNPSKYARRNYFNVITIKVNGDFSWISYWNKATFTKGKIVETVVWLESAVLVKKDNRWKIQMLHSTRVKPEDLPQNIVLTEYKN